MSTKFWTISITNLLEEVGSRVIVSGSSSNIPSTSFSVAAILFLTASSSLGL